MTGDSVVEQLRRDYAGTGGGAEMPALASMEGVEAMIEHDPATGDPGDDDRPPGAPESAPSEVQVAGPPKFNASRLATQITTDVPMATSVGGSLFVYREGAYRPDGDAWLRREVARRLGDEWRKGRAEEVVAYVRAVAPRLWERPPLDKVNCRNGVLDLDSGKLAAHDPAFLSPVQIGASFDPAAKCPAIDRFLPSVLADDLVPLVHELAGYLVVPDQSLQTAVMLLGEGANGKSTLLSLITALLGAENVANVALHRLDEDRFAAAELLGRLANVFADLDARALQASSIFKAITGGDAITGERKYHPAFSFKPYARLLYSANEPPPTPDSSDAFFRRWLILPFEQRFDGRRADRNLIDRLTTAAELSGLLNYAIEALPGLRTRGAFAETSATAKAADRFRVDSDSVAGFLGDVCELDPDARTPKPRLFDAYRAWCGESNRKPLGKQKFNRRVEALRPMLDADAVFQGTRCWGGIRLEVE